MTVTRGTTNGNVRGNTRARAARRAWLVEAYRADVDVVVATYDDLSTRTFTPEPGGLTAEWVASFVLRCDAALDDPMPAMILGGNEPRVLSAVVTPACRCYRCGNLLTEDTLTVDRIFPGVLGGLYRTVLRDKREKVTNIRPACGPCNETTGGRLATRDNRKK